MRLRKKGTIDITISIELLCQICCDLICSLKEIEEGRNYRYNNQYGIAVSDLPTAKTFLSFKVCGRTKVNFEFLTQKIL